jgi:hypothetical protein
MVLITSREQLGGLITTHEARPIPLGTLDDTDARELLAKRLGHERLAAEPTAVDKLVKYCAGLPLALAIVAAHAATHTDFPLAELVSELGETSVRLDALNGGELTANLRAVLSWSYRALTDDAAEVFRLLGLVPGPDIAAPAAAVLTGLPDSSVAVLLADGPERGEAALRRLIHYYVHATYAGERLLYPHRKNVDVGPPPPDYPVPHSGGDTSILNWFDAEHFCLLAAQEAAVKHEWHQFVWQLGWTLHGYLWRRGHLLEQLHTWRLGLAAAHQLRDPGAEGVASRLLGQACARAGMNTSASEYLYRALDLAREIGDTHSEARGLRVRRHRRWGEWCRRVRRAWSSASRRVRAGTTASRGPA